MSRREPAAAFDALIGRDELLARLEPLVRDARLVTLTGPGGTGKTRLARSLMARRIAAGHEAVFVDLSGLREPGLAASAVATSLRLAESAELGAADLVTAFLRDRALDLVLDNLEQLAGLGRLLPEWLRDCPGLRIIGTSRIPLRIRGEVEFLVPPLDLPADESVDSVERSAAGRLFLQRARAIGRLTAVDDRSAATIAALLRGIDGLPLAIELAAARTRVLEPGSILARLDDPATLAAPGRDGLAAISLEAILAWSVDSLTGTEREILLAACVPAGSFALPLIEALRPGVDALAALDALIAGGLVVAEGGAGQARFRLLETVRAFARRRRPDDEMAADRTAVARLLAERYRAFDAGPGFWGGFWGVRDDDSTITELFEGSPPIPTAVALDLAIALAPWWMSAGRLRDPETWLGTLIDATDEPSQRARGLLALALLRRERGGTPAAAPLQEQALAISRTIGDRRLELDALVARANALAGALEAESAVWFEQAAGLASDLGLDRRVAEIRVNMARARVAGADPLDDRRHLLAVLDVARDLGPASEVDVLTQLAVIDESLGWLDEAREHADRAADLGRQGGRDWWVLTTRGSILAKLGRQTEARQALRDGLGLVALGFADPRPRMAAIALLSSLAHLAATGRTELAVRSFGAARAALEQIGERIAEPEARMDDAIMARARAGLGSVAWKLAERAGREAGAGRMLREVIAALEAAEAGTAPARPRSIGRHAGLTAREVEVLSLVADGRSDREIAARLDLNPKTVSVHVANAKGKLFATSRLDLALRARSLGLSADDAAASEARATSER